MKRISIPILLAVPVLWLGGCNLEDGGSDPVFTCDASATVVEMCLEEPASPSTQEASKSTCLSVKGTWSDSKKCPSSYKQKCKDGNKTSYFYSPDDADTPCSQLVFLIDPDRTFAAAFTPMSPAFP